MDTVKVKRKQTAQVMHWSRDCVDMKSISAELGKARTSAFGLLSRKTGPSAIGPVSVIAGGQVRQQIILSLMQIGKSARIGLAVHI